MQTYNVPPLNLQKHLTCLFLIFTYQKGSISLLEATKQRVGISRREACSKTGLSPTLTPQQESEALDLISLRRPLEISHKYENKTHPRKMFGFRRHRLSLHPLRFRFSTMSTPQTIEF